MTTAETIRKKRDRLTVLLSQKTHTSLDLCEMVELQQDIKKLGSPNAFTLYCPRHLDRPLDEDRERCPECEAEMAEAHGV
jgi:hypothetical protein